MADLSEMAPVMRRWRVPSEVLYSRTVVACHAQVRVLVWCVILRGRTLSLHGRCKLSPHDRTHPHQL